MQKKLLALAVAGVMCAPLAAQADSSNVQIYGRVVPSLDRVDNGDKTGTSMQNNNSRIGFKGSEDLGNGLKAIFQLESAVDFDNRGGAGWTRRDSWAGLSSATWGTLRFGTAFTAYKNSTAYVDVMEDTVADYNNIMGVSWSGSDGFNDRARNAIHYKTPNFSGFQAEATYGMEQGGTGAKSQFESDGADTMRSLGVSYKAGGLHLAAGYENQQMNRLGGTDNAKAWKVSAGYKFGNTTVNALYAKEDFGDNLTPATFGGYVIPAGDIKGKSAERDLVYLSAKHSIGNIDLMAAYTWADDFDGLKKSGADSYAVGAQYNFSKRTRVGAYYVYLDNDRNAGYGLDAGYDPAKNGEKIKAFSVQLRHLF